MSLPHIVGESPFLNMGDPRLSLVFLPSSEDPDSSYALDLFHPIVGLVDSNFAMLSSANYNPLPVDSPRSDVDNTNVVDMPVNALVVFLRKDDPDDESDRENRLAISTDFLSRAPWTFHHSELVARHRIKACPENSHDYFLAYPNLPLCSVRQIHCGEEHIRIVRFASDEKWQDTLDFYMLILGHDYDCAKPDFCIFTIQHLEKFDIQFALKKLPQGVRARTTNEAILSITVTNIGLLVPLLPHACHQVSDSHWVTTDYDGNYVFLEEMQTQQKSKHFAKKHKTPTRTRSPSRSHMHADTMTSEDDSLFHSGTDGDAPSSSTPYRHHNVRRAHHQHTDSGFIEDSSEVHKVNLKKMFQEFSDASLSELFGRKQPQPKTKYRKSRVPEASVGRGLDLSVQSAYGEYGYSSPVQPARERVCDRLRMGELRARSASPRVDPKQAFTEMWVLNGHLERPARPLRRHGSSDDQVSTSSYSSIDTAISDPCSDRGHALHVRKSRLKPQLPVTEEKERALSPAVFDHGPRGAIPTPPPCHLETNSNDVTASISEDFNQEPVDVPANLVIQRSSYSSTQASVSAASRGFCDGVIAAEVHCESRDFRDGINRRSPSSIESSPKGILSRKQKKVSFDEHDEIVQIESICEETTDSCTNANIVEPNSRTALKGKSSVQSIIDSLQASIAKQGKLERNTENMPTKQELSKLSEIDNRSSVGNTTCDSISESNSQVGFWI